MKKAFLVKVITYFFIILFLYTGVAKLMDVHVFKEQLISSPLMSSLAGIITWALPIGELLLAVALFIPAFQLKGLFATLALMSLFTIYVVTILFMDNHLSCSCGGMIENLSPRQHVIFNSACVILSAVAITLARRQEPVTRVKWWTGASVLSLFLFLGWILFTAFSTPATAKTGMEGRLLPPMDLLLEDSVTHFNTSNIPDGQPFVIIGFDPFCKHCQAETQDLLQHIQQLKGTHIYYVTPYPFWQMKAFYQYFKLAQYSNITIGRDAQDRFLKYFEAPNIPFTVIFDAHKRLNQAYVGELDANKLIQAINRSS